MKKDNNQKNQMFLDLISSTAKNLILDNIANHYGITRKEALDEVVDGEAEQLLEYMTGVERNAALVLMKKYGYA
jgi:hypothetical protein